MSVSRSDITATLLDFLREETGLEIEEVTEDMSLRDSLGLNSVDLVGVVMRIESHYRIRLSQTDLQQLATLGTVIDLIQRKIEDTDQEQRRAA